MLQSGFINERLTLYRRSPLWIKHQFDEDNSESSINKHMIGYRAYSKVVEPEHPERVWPGGDLGPQKIELDDGTSYWSLVSTGGWFEIYLLDKYNTYKIYEVMYDYANPGIGELRVWFNNHLTEVIKGPSAWMSSLPHKSIDGVMMKCRQRNFGLSEPPPRGEIDNLRIYYYAPIKNCEIAKYSPPKASSGPVGINTLRGFTAFQTTMYIGTECPMTLRFDDSGWHTDFLYYADKPHVLCDDKGTFYRGVLELGESRWLGGETYEQDVIFRSPNKLGEGWI